jgi:hypothetical protein
MPSNSHVFEGVPIIAPSLEFLISAFDDYDMRSIWHQTANTVGCTDEPVHLDSSTLLCPFIVKPCCAVIETVLTQVPLR